MSLVVSLFPLSLSPLQGFFPADVRLARVIVLCPDASSRSSGSRTGFFQQAFKDVTAVFLGHRSSASGSSTSTTTSNALSGDQPARAVDVPLEVSARAADVGAPVEFCAEPRDLLRFFQLSHLPALVGGSLVYKHDIWMEQRAVRS